MDKIFGSAHHRRIFFAAATLFFLVLVTARYFLTPIQNAQISQLHTTALAILDNITTGYFASIILAVVVYYFRPKRENENNLQQLNANDIVPSFEKALAEANRWMFKGNRGRYLRSKVLPSLAQRMGAFSIEAIYINPFNEDICKKYVEHKNVSISNDQGSDWDVKKVQADILATIVVCAWFKRFPSLSINIFLNNVFEPIRMDSNSHTTFLTVENKREPCLIIYEGHFLNQWMHDQFILVKHQAIEAKLNKINKAHLTDLTIDDIKTVCLDLGHDNIDQDILDQALEIAKKNKDPYGRN